MLNNHNTKEDFLRRLKASKARKRARINELVEDLKEKYEKSTGLKANYVEVW